MIKKIELANVATFNDSETFKPNTINYLFGGNGTGKTTIGKVINDCDSHPECHITWSLNPTGTIIYNKEFVEKNFSQSESIKGIFTLGKDSTDVKQKLEDAREKVDELTEKIQSNKEHIEKNEIEFKQKEENYIERAWSVKDKYMEHFKPAYRGYLGSKKSFFEKCLYESKNESDLLEEPKIIEKCDQVFSESLSRYNEINNSDFSKLIDLQQSKVLREKIIGKEDLEIGELIRKLNNSDWVKEGLGYLDHSNEVCPFCQQSVADNLRSEIESFFDESYRKKIDTIKKIRNEYDLKRDKLLEEIDQIIKQDVPFLDFTELLKKKNLFEEKTKNNLRIIEDKTKNPSVPAKIDSIDDISLEITKIIDQFNNRIRENNETVINIDQEKKILKSQIWRFLIDKLELDLKSYSQEKSNHEKALKGMKSSLKNHESELSNLEIKIEKLESSITSVQHSVNEINKLLRSFGFTNFQLRKANKKGFYELVRNDGRKVGQTLSEGEYTFITFLYFYQLLKGSTDETGITKNKIVVIDDPISSLDSSVLFVVSNLIKSIVRDAKEGKNGIKQIFILTHNVYFFKEVTFRGSRHNKWKEESYWLVQKSDDQSRITEHKENPIKTTYELLWRELDEPDHINTATIFNTMRRILEYYFNILGNLDYGVEAIDKFEGDEKLICKSLIGWINDGSHFINDDLAVTVDSSDIEKYMKVFKDIFYKMNHGSHYEMMMKKPTVAS